SATKATAATGKVSNSFAGMGTGIVMATAAAGAASLKLAVDFEESIAKAGAVADASKQQMQEWSNSVLDMSRKFPQSAKDMAEALYWIKSDMPDASDAEQFATLEIAAKGATGGIAELEAATEALVTVQNAYANSGVELKGPTDYMDAMNMAVKRGSITLEEFVANMGKATGTAAIAKVPFTEVSAAVATLTKKAVPAETAFMALNQTMMTYLKPTKEAVDVSKQYGIELSLANLRTKGLAASMMELAEKVPDEELATLFPNIRALKAVLPLAGVSTKDFAKDLEEMGKRAGTTEQMFGTMSDTTALQFKTTLNELKAVAIEVGTTALPILKDNLSALAGAFDVLNAVKAPTILGWLNKLANFANAFNPIGLISGIKKLADWMGGGKKEYKLKLDADDSKMMEVINKKRESKVALTADEKKLVAKIEKAVKGKDPNKVIDLRVKETTDTPTLDQLKEGWVPTIYITPDVDMSQVDAAKTRAHQGWTASLVPDVDESQITAAKTRARQGWSATLVPNVDESLITAAKTRAHQGWTATMTVNTQTSVNPMFDNPYDAGLYMGEQISKGAGAAAPSIALGASLDNAFKALSATALVGWSKAIDNIKWGEIEQGIASLGGPIGENIGAWRKMTQEFDKSKAALEAFEAQIETAEEAVTKTELQISKTQATISKLSEELDRLSNMKLKGEGAADDKSFAQQQAIQKLELERLQIQQRIRQGTATEADFNRLFVIAQKKQELELEKEILDTQTSLKYDEQHRKLEKLLNPLEQQEMSYDQIRKKIVKAQKELTKQEKLLVKQEARLDRQNTLVDELRKRHDRASEAVQRYSQIIDAMADNFLKRYQEMMDAQEKLNNGMTGASGSVGGANYASPSGSTVNTSSMAIYNFDNLTLPNVTDAESFTRELSNVNLRAQVS
ncbi:MAG: phage tail tape measure protein, partial [Anaerovoracaceae bacterium]